MFCVSIGTWYRCKGVCIGADVHVHCVSVCQTVCVGCIVGGYFGLSPSWGNASTGDYSCHLLHAFLHTVLWCLCTHAHSLDGFQTPVLPAGFGVAAMRGPQSVVEVD